ncbi:hypothetical protein BEWA_048430 [Theileria equi strain WA]|uniref:Uncharacterized protein n=1 Tax=Theileria equi strain WA TaxID=1537102 RepID=L1LAN2_THEEQ|nr:hypothetical protein BEWA_048430 [Theileria equi strain WA]EKX72376.1 hypothetical protein BEWA_048430 [Theileria equi strain WA]|eukprot:XP_004831828.1 hypothetical protein BEWA_048430 [Theileria equi strain WA]
MSGELQLDISKRCDDEKEDSKCKCGKNGISNLKAKKVTNIDNVTNFTKFVHRVPDGSTFKLSRNLGNLGTIRATVGSGVPIPDVTEVSVYFWNGEPSNPILLGITTKNGNPKTKYYSKSNDWLHGPVSALSEQEALDEHNCQKNNAIVFNIENSESGSHLKNTQATCMKNTRTIERVTIPHSQNPPGSEYTVVGYNINGIGDRNKDTKISRVTLRGKPITISPPTYPIDTIMLYSYLGSSQVPLLVEFIKQGRTESKWYESQDSNGNNWGEVGSGTGFYDYGRGDDPKPTAKLSEKLDEVLCKQHNNVTINLTRGTSETHASSQKPYCCSDHKGDGRILVRKGEIKVSGQTKISYYKHSITTPSLNLAGIYYNDSRDNARSKISGLPFPIDGVRSVYAFYCAGETPLLIYVDSENPTARGWYKRYNGQWRWNPKLSVINPNDINDGPSCAKWKRLKTVLTECSCTNLTDDCSGNPEQQADEEKQLRQEEEKAIKERTEALQRQTHYTQYGQSAAGQGAFSSSGSRSSGSSGRGSESSSSSRSPPQVTIKLSVKPPSGGAITTTTTYTDPTGGRQITVKSANEPSIDFLKYEHTDSTGKPFTLLAVLDDQDVTVSGAQNIPKVTSVSAYYWQHRLDMALLVEIQDSTGNYKYYENSKNNEWKDITGDYLPKGSKLSEYQLLQKLTLLNCEINDVVQIDVTETGDYCHNDKVSHSTKKVKVSEILGSYKYLGNYVAYAHTPNSDAYTGGKSPHKFNISGFTNGKTPITLSGLHLPIMDANKVIVYFCKGEVNAIRSSGKSVNNPLLIYLPNSDQGERWFKKPDSGTEWTLVNKLNGKECFDNAVVDFLDTLESICRPPEVTINIYNRTIGNTYAYGDDFGRWITVNGGEVVGASGFTEYTHTISGSTSYFTLQNVNYQTSIIDAIITSTKSLKYVTSVSVFYWCVLEDPARKDIPDKRGRPLLVKITTQEPGRLEKSIYYENVSTSPTDNSKWKLWTPPGFPLRPMELENKLELLNCNINNVVNIDVSRTRGNYCGHRHSHIHRKVSVKEVGEKNLGRYRAFEHRPNEKVYTGNPGSTHTFHISEFTSGRDGTLDGLLTPVLDVKKVIVYFCRGNPLLLYIDSNTPNYKDKWFKSDDRGGTWKSAATLNGENKKDSDYGDIVNLLDALQSSCKPPSVTIDVYQRDSLGHVYHSYTDTSPSGKILVTGVRNNPPSFTKYQHTVDSTAQNPLTLKQVNYNGKPTHGIGNLPMSKVNQVSVFYWTALENNPDKKDESRPLLIKVILYGGSEKWYENKGEYLTNNTEWKEVEHPSDPGREFKEPATLRKKLHLLNCKLNDAVVIDVSHRDIIYDACNDTDKLTLDPQHGNDRMQVKKDDESGKFLGSYTVYTHTLNTSSSGNGKFHIVSFKNDKTPLTGISASYTTPILNVDEVKAYFCGQELAKPLLFYYNTNGKHHWYKNTSKDSNSTGEWELAEPELSNIGPEDHEKIKELLNKLGGKCKSPEELPTSRATEPPTTDESQPAKFGAETVATGLGIWSISGISSGTLTGAGGLTGLGWWAFKRSRGDPWVINGYPIVFKECTILSMHILL